MTKEERKQLKEISEKEKLDRNDFSFVLHTCFNSRGYDMAKELKESPSYIVDVVNYRKILNSDLSAKIIEYCKKAAKPNKRTKANL
ncbi:MAG TPA: hypothetical protein V6C58_24595 [Allocoleopsis sp.]